MQAPETAADQEFVASFALQRQRLLHHVGSMLAGSSTAADPAVTQMSQTLVTSLELLKVAEDELREERRTSAMLSLVQERRIAHLTALFELAPTALVLTGTDTSIREANPAATALLGRDMPSLAGRQLSEMVPASQRIGFREQLVQAMESGRVAAWSFTLEVQRAAPVVVTATVSLINDAAVGTRALYWNIRPA
jgi:PAS domain S-box-containing protein